MNAVVIVVVVGMVVALAYVKSYNRLVSSGEVVDDAWATLEDELASRHELIPALVEAVTAGAVGERRLLDELIRIEEVAAQAHSGPGARSDPEHDLATAAEAVVALREQYPALDSQRNFLRLRHELAINEDRISASRHFYNMRVADLNRRVQAFPSSLVARRHGITAAVYFDV